MLPFEVTRFSYLQHYMFKLLLFQSSLLKLQFLFKLYLVTVTLAHTYIYIYIHISYIHMHIYNIYIYIHIYIYIYIYVSFIVGNQWKFELRTLVRTLKMEARTLKLRKFEHASSSTIGLITSPRPIPSITNTRKSTCN